MLCSKRQPSLKTAEAPRKVSVSFSTRFLSVSKQPRSDGSNSVFVVQLSSCFCFFF